MNGQPKANRSNGLSYEAAEGDVPSVELDGATGSHEEFSLELEKAQAVGIPKLSNEALLNHCKGAYGQFKRYWVNARPFFLELWRRLEDGLVPEIRTKAEVCERIGCSIRWAQMIVSGYAETRDQKKPGNPPICEGSSLATQPHSADQQPVKHAGSSRLDRILTAEEYVLDIQRFAFRKLRKVREQRLDRYRNVCGILAEDFRQACQIEAVAEAKAA